MRSTEIVQESKLDRSAYLREVLRKGFSLDKQDRLLLKYVRKELSQMEVCKELKWDPWEFLTQLKARNLYLNVELEDWLDAVRTTIVTNLYPVKCLWFSISLGPRSAISESLNSLSFLLLPALYCLLLTAF